MRLTEITDAAADWVCENWAPILVLPAIIAMFAVVSAFGILSYLKSEETLSEVDAGIELCGETHEVEP